MTSDQTSSLVASCLPSHYPTFPRPPSGVQRPSRMTAIPSEIWLSVVRLMFESEEFVSLACFAATSKFGAAIAQPFLYRDVVIRRSNNRNRKRAEIERRKVVLLALLQRRPVLKTYIRSIFIHSSCRDTWWLTNETMIALVSYLFRRDDTFATNLTSVSVVGHGRTGLDGRLFHTTIFASLPPTVLSVTLSNIRFLSPRVFYALSHVSQLRFTNVFCHAIGCRTVSSLVQAVPPAPVGRRPVVRHLEYSRQVVQADTYYGSPCEVVGQYVQLGQLVEGSFRTDHADDYSMLFAVLQQAAGSLRVLTLDVTGITIDRYFRQYPRSTQFPALHALTDLALVVTYSSDHPVREHPWKGLVFALNSLNTPLLERLIVRIVYRSYWKVDFMRFLAASSDWEVLDSALRARMHIFPSLRIALEFRNFGRSQTMLWGQGERARAFLIHQYIQTSRNVGELRYGVLTLSQIARMLPSLFSMPSARSRIDFSWT
ncbi:hypothetical protein CC1G_04155 [Coprinopsis cinerea okayama7|uniref:F-box domain-containing protein n=1 Tax=Coprinopsis cinerea (strain Okayama-7 / 130 / ATCC MYA-4618 / FGSC 9003) TaxID=240176 RepID=A8NW67_COPC7|nr:hypothetical protein CC1G_04155 [Coprinopsis cinerea okayama7\|eukprot:XP_001836842.2 hypothetical protein CC1G_04155 [Coprinopsis cinerea okayama7\